MEFDIKVQNLAMIYYQIERLLPKEVDLRITRKVLNRCLPTMRYLFMTL
jgi:hypothetical protein